MQAKVFDLDGNEITGIFEAEKPVPDKVKVFDPEGNDITDLIFPSKKTKVITFYADCIVITEEESK